MLRTPPELDPTPRALRAIRWLVLGLAALGLPAGASALTFDVLDASGFGASVTLEDGEVPGTLDVDIESVAPLGQDLIGDILAIYIVGDAPGLGAGAAASGEDVEEVSSLAGDPNVLVNIGPSSLFELNGITSTSFVLSHATDAVSLAALAGATLQVWLGFDGTDPNAPGFAFNDEVNVVKPGAPIPVIPEPGTAAMMMLGLMGLAASARRMNRELRSA